MSNKIVKVALEEDPDVIQVKKHSELASQSLVEQYRLGNEELDGLSEAEDCLNLQWGRDYDKR